VRSRDASRRVLQIAPGGPSQPGGATRYAADLAAALRRKGADVAVVQIGPGVEAGAVEGGVAEQPTPIRVLRHWWVVQRTSRRGQVLDSHFALYGVLPFLIGRSRRLPKVVHFHGPWADEARATGSSEMAAKAMALVERTTYRRAQHLVVLSQAFRQVLISQYGVDTERVHVIPPGVDLDRFAVGDRAAARERLGVGRDAQVAVAARRLVPRMGLSVLLEAWADGLATDSRLLLVVGDGPERGPLEAEARRRGIDASVRFLGQVSDATLVDAYQCADVALAPSLRLEGFGLVVLEAMACGVPTIVSNVGGLPEALSGFDQSLVVAPGAVSQLRDRIAAAFDGEAPSAEECRAHAERFSWSAAVARHEEIFNVMAPVSTQRMRVVIVNHSSVLSGAEIYLLRLLPYLNNVFEVHLLLAEDGPLADQARDIGVNVEILSLALRAKGLRRSEARMGLSALQAAALSGLYSLRIARRIRQLKPAVVHTNSLKAAFLGLPAARLARVPAVAHVHDRLDQDHLSRVAVSTTRALLARLPTVVVANSQSTLESLGRARRLDRRGNRMVAPGPVAAAVAAPGHGERPFTVGMVGRLSPWKGQHLFLEAFALAFPDGSERAVIVGAPLFGEHEYAESVRERGTRSDLAGRVEFLGFRDDVADLFQSFDALAHASVAAEPFGMAVVEGMAAGLPVVATDAGGPAEVITDDVDGLLYPMGDAKALASQLRRLADDSELRHRLGMAARRRAADFTPDKIAAVVIGAYRRAAR
jgi:glycosyltransferase involved in cell wall biosynthesis